MNKKFKIIISFIAIILVSIFLCFTINAIGLDDLSTFKKIINDNIWGAGLYILILSLQVVFIPINSLILIIPAIMVFGAIKAFVFSFIALLIGSCTAYYIGKVFGNSLLKFFADRNSIDKLQNTLSQNGKFVLPILLLVPIFPDEVICILAGIAKLKFGYFFVVSFVTRLIDLTCTCFIGAILPMHGWWLVLWAILFVFSTIIAIWIGKNHNKIQNKVFNFINNKLKLK